MLHKSQGDTESSATRNNDNPHSIPVGHWRDGLCDCCVFGCCHPLVCLTTFFGLLTLGQVMTRMKLNLCAEPAVRGTSTTWSPFKVILVAFIAYNVIDYGITMATLPYRVFDETGQQVSAAPGVAFVLFMRNMIRLSVYVYILMALVKTRAHIRRTFGIPETSCRGCEDICCAFWCGCCTITQMARHTADYRTYRAACCSETGLGDNVPPTTAPRIV